MDSEPAPNNKELDSQEKGGGNYPPKLHLIIGCGVDIGPHPGLIEQVAVVVGGGLLFGTEHIRLLKSGRHGRLDFCGQLL